MKNVAIISAAFAPGSLPPSDRIRFARHLSRVRFNWDNKKIRFLEIVEKTLQSTRFLPPVSHHIIV